MAKNKEYISFSMDFGSLHGFVFVLVGEDWTIGLNKVIEQKDFDTDWKDAIQVILGENILTDNNSLGMALKRTVDTTSYYFLLMKSFDFSNSQHHVVLAHEILHLCQFHLPDFFDRNREIEFEAYTHSHLMTQFYNSIKA